jgi:hypothetical protein
MESKDCGVLDTPLEPVIGVAKGETRWRGMTTARVNAQSTRYLIAKASFCSLRVSSRPLDKATRSARCHGPN